MKRRKLTSRLIEKSKEALLLAIEIYNKPTVQYRLEAFAIFYTNAWELLMKAKIVEDTKKEKSIFLPKRKKTEIQSAIKTLIKDKKGYIDADILSLLERIELNEKRKLETEQKDRSITFYEAISKTFPSKTDPIRANILDIQDLRNSSAHLFVEEIENIYSGLFQQGVLNYLKHLRLWFEEEIKITPRMLSLVFEFQPKDITSVRIRSKYPRDIQTFIQERQSAVIQNIETYGSDYSIAIDTKLYLSKKPGKDAIDLSLSGKLSEAGIGTISVPKNIDETHPYFSAEVLEKITSLLSDATKAKLKKGKLNQYDLTCIKAYLKISPTSKGEYIALVKASKKQTTSRYSEKFVEDIAKRIEDEENFLANARSSQKKPNQNNS